MGGSLEFQYHLLFEQVDAWCSLCGLTMKASKFTINDMQQLATRRRGKCLSSVYVNISTSLLWQCAHGHQWKATPDNIKRGKWCPYCRGRHKTIDDMHRFARDRGGKCLSSAYVNPRTRLLWECAKGHRWKAVPNSIQQGTWCPVCSGNLTLTIEDMQHLAAERGGKCLSDVYLSNRRKLLWQCAEGHQWQAVPGNIRQGNWCPYCAGRGKTIEDMRRIAKGRGGKCLSKVYVSAQAHLLWECAQEHRWKARPNNVIRGSWCPHCAGIAPKTLEDMQVLAKERGGRCLSDHYVNSQTKLLWECIEEHQWESPPNRIQQGQWCPECSAGLGERICRAFFEQLFGKRFPTRWPRWLVNRRGNRMELDGYCEALKLAFEHQGEQHFSTKTQYLKTVEALRKRQEDDTCKVKVCEEHDIILLAVPEIPYRLAIGEVKAFIKAACLSWGVDLPRDFDTKAVDLRAAYCASRARRCLQEMQAIASKRGGTCLSEAYVNAKTKLLWECKQGHRWEMAPSRIRQGGWCARCAGTYRYTTIADMDMLAQERGGHCLSDRYANSHTRLLWECAKGHRWEATPNSVQQGSWCPACKGRVKVTISDMRALAEAKGGKCLSDEYAGVNRKILWQCAKGHKWKAATKDIRRGSWCPICAGNVRLTLADMQAISAARGGKCLSDRYVNSVTKMLWECSKGHRWEAPPIRIRQGGWCPYCAGKIRLTIDDMRAVAAERGGRCLSDKYVDNKTKLLWECKRGHRWKAQPNNVKHGQWCPYCVGKYKSIEDMRRMAREKGGKCLSNTYVSAKTRLDWECGQGHQWRATPDSIKRGSWCPICARLESGNR